MKIRKEDTGQGPMRAPAEQWGGDPARRRLDRRRRLHTGVAMMVVAADGNALEVDVCRRQGRAKGV